MSDILKTTNLTKKFAGKMAVDHLSIQVNRGDIYGFIGENGAGKTTLMRMVCGLAKPSGGEINLFGSRDLTSQRHRIGCTIENPALFPTMTATENMEVQRRQLGLVDRNCCMRVLETVGLSKTGKKKAKDFSLGMKQRLMIGLALLGDPEFLVLDEPTNGLDPMGIKEVRDLFLHLNQERKITILISSHILGELEKITTRYGVISGGKMVDEFQAEELATRCGENLVLRISDIATTERVMKELWPDATIELLPDQSLRLLGHAEDAADLNEQLVKAGVRVEALIPEGETLEDYFMKLMRGVQYA